MVPHNLESYFQKGSFHRFRQQRCFIPDLSDRRHKLWKLMCIAWERHKSLILPSDEWSVKFCTTLKLQLSSFYEMLDIAQSWKTLFRTLKGMKCLPRVWSVQHHSLPCSHMIFFQGEWPLTLGTVHETKLSDSEVLADFSISLLHRTWL